MKRYILKLVSSTAENIFSANFSLKPTCQQKICNPNGLLVTLCILQCRSICPRVKMGFVG